MAMYADAATTPTCWLLLIARMPAQTINSLQVEAGTPVAIYAEDKGHAMAVGLTTLSTQEMRDVNKGIGVELMHHLNDALWKTPKMQ